MDPDHLQLDIICDFGAECQRRGERFPLRFGLYAGITLWAYDLGWRESEWTLETRARTAT